MVKRKTGHVVTLTSFQGIYPLPYSLAYCAARSGVTAFMLALKEFIRQRGLRKRIVLTCVMHDVSATREENIKAVNPA